MLLNFLCCCCFFFFIAVFFNSGSPGSFRRKDETVFMPNLSLPIGQLLAALIDSMSCIARIRNNCYIVLT